MEKSCGHCGIIYEREQGFFLGAIYFNYGLTAVIVTIAYIALTIGQFVAPSLAFGGSLVFVVLFPLWFFRYARSLWLAFDQFVDPRQAEKVDTESVKQRSRSK